MTQSRSTGGKVKERNGPWWDSNPQGLTPMSPKSNALPLTLPRLPKKQVCEVMQFRNSRWPIFFSFSNKDEAHAHYFKGLFQRTKKRKVNEKSKVSASYCIMVHFGKLICIIQTLYLGINESYRFTYRGYHYRH